MPELDDSVSDFLATVANATRRRDAHTLIGLMTRVTGEPARMWGSSVIGFGRYHYRYASGREGDSGAAGFSPRKAATTVYFPDGVGAYEGQLAVLGPHTTGVGCVYLKNLDDVDLAVLESMIAESFRIVTAGTYGHRARESADGRPS